MTISALPPAPSRQDPDNFASKADTFVAALGPLVTQINAESVIMLGYKNAAAASAVAADASADAADVSEAAAAASAFAADASADASAASAAAAAATYVDFDERWLGEKASDPSTNNQGQPLTEGVLYYNTGTHLLRIYNGLIWVNALGSTVGEFTIFRQEFTATAGQTVFALANRFEVGTNNLMVYQGGLRLGNSGYTETDDHTVTLATPATLGQKVLFEIGVVSSAGATAAGAVSLGPVVGLTATNVQDGITELVGQMASVDTGKAEADGSNATGNWPINSANITGIAAIANGGHGSNTAHGGVNNLNVGRTQVLTLADNGITLVAGKVYSIYTPASDTAWVINIPNSFPTGSEITLINLAGSWVNSKVTLTRLNAGHLINDLAENVLFNSNARNTLTLVSSNGTYLVLE